MEILRGFWNCFSFDRILGLKEVRKEERKRSRRKKDGEIVRLTLQLLSFYKYAESPKQTIIISLPFFPPQPNPILQSASKHTYTHAPQDTEKPYVSPNIQLIVPKSKQLPT